MVTQDSQQLRGTRLPDLLINQHLCPNIYRKVEAGERPVYKYSLSSSQGCNYRILPLL